MRVSHRDAGARKASIYAIPTSRRMSKPAVITYAGGRPANDFACRGEMSGWARSHSGTSGCRAILHVPGAETEAAAEGSVGGAVRSRQIHPGIDQHLKPVASAPGANELHLNPPHWVPPALSPATTTRP